MDNNSRSVPQTAHLSPKNLVEKVSPSARGSAVGTPGMDKPDDEVIISEEI